MLKYKTYSEYLAHPKFQDVCRHVSCRSGGRCEWEIIRSHGPERCSAKAVHFHHIVYCKWGDFDEPENLLHLCKECHVLAHTCDTCGCVFGSEPIKAGRTQCFDCYASKPD